MNRKPSRVPATNRLRTVQRRMQALLKGSSWLKGMARDSLNLYLGLCRQYQDQVNARMARETAIIRKNLGAGRIMPSSADIEVPVIAVRVHGDWPTALIKKLTNHPDRSRLPKGLEAEVADAALKVLNFNRTLAAAELDSPAYKRLVEKRKRAREAGRTAAYSRWITAPAPVNWNADKPASPIALTRVDLLRLPPEERRIVALYRLTKLADLNSLNPLSPDDREPSTGDLGKDVVRLAVHDANTPTSESERLNDDPSPSPDLLNPAIAEQMLGIIEEWMQSEKAQAAAAARAGIQEATPGEADGTQLDLSRERAQLCAKVAELLRAQPSWFRAQLVRWTSLVARPAEDGLIARLELLGPSDETQELDALCAHRLASLARQASIETAGIAPESWTPMSVLVDDVALSAARRRANLESWQQWYEVARASATAKDTHSSGIVFKPSGWTRSELIQEANKDGDLLQTSKFDHIRRRAGVAPGKRGGGGANRRFSVAEVKKLNKALRSGGFRFATEISAAWEHLVTAPSAPS